MTNNITPNRQNEVPVLPAQMELIEEQLRDLLQWASTLSADSEKVTRTDTKRSSRGSRDECKRW
jgi:hypothetical protein